MSERYTRREVMKKAVSAGMGAAALAAMPRLLAGQEAKTAPAGRADKRPNIVFILVDDLAETAVGYAGRFPFLKTPHIDALAAGGVVFTNAFVTTSLCSPARASFLTGAYVHNHGVRDNRGACDPQLTTFPRMLQQAGYETAFVGKWHMVRKDDPRPGFDYWLSFVGQGVYRNPELNENGRKFKADGYITDLLTDHAVRWLQQPRHKPFCMLLWHKAVHGPFTPADRHAAAFPDAEIPEPASFKDTFEGKPNWQKQAQSATKAAQAAVAEDATRGASARKWDGRAKHRLEMLRTVLAVDDSVGRIVQTLKEQGQLDNTLIVFAGDNGYFFGEHGRMDKRLAYEESMRIPLVMHCPKRMTVLARKIPQMALNIDIAATVLDLAGIQAPPSVDGRSLLPLPGGQPIAWRDSFLYEYYKEGSFATPTMVGVRTPRWKYVQYPEIPGEIDELYDLKADPIEMHNLAADAAHANDLAAMKDLLEKTKRDTGYKLMPEVPPTTRAAVPAAKKAAKKAGGDAGEPPGGE